jgi:hypothetical protein
MRVLQAHGTGEARSAPVTRRTVSSGHGQRDRAGRVLHLDGVAVEVAADQHCERLHLVLVRRLEEHRLDHARRGEVEELGQRVHAGDAGRALVAQRARLAAGLAGREHGLRALDVGAVAAVRAGEQRVSPASAVTMNSSEREPPMAPLSASTIT